MMDELRGSGWERGEVNDAAAPPPTRPAHARANAGVVRGISRWSETGFNNSTTQVITFRIERFDASGAALPPIPVEMRALSMHGTIREGDWVVAPDRWQRGKTLKPRRIHNLTTGTDLRGTGRVRGVVARLFFLLFVAAVVAIFVLIAKSGFQ
jgi:hypothetical protein